MKLAKFRKTFRVDAHAVGVEYDVFMKSTASRLTLDGAVVAEDTTDDGPEQFRNHRLATTLPDGRALEVEVGPASAWAYGARASVDGQVVFETHPGRPLAYGEGMQRYMKWAESVNTPEEKARQKAAWKRNWPSLAVDVVLGLAFFLVAREFGLVTAAVGGAVAGLVLWGLQKLTRVDLLGGLAMFGIVMGLASAAFALVFQDERIVQMRGTIMGVVGAVPFLIDGLTGGQRLAARMARYLNFGVDAGRLGIGMGVIGLVMAGLNWAAVEWLSRDAWLVFSTFLDAPIAVVAFFVMILWARKGPDVRTY